jgi:hypothetical protein
VKLVRSGAADRAGIGSDGTELQSETSEYARIGVEHVAVFALQVIETAVERVPVLHQEFAAAHDTETRPDFVAKLDLYLVEVHGQLAVALHLLAYDIGNHLFVRRTNDEIALVPILAAQQFGTILLPAPGLLPQFCWLHCRHRQLDRPSAIHLLADDLLHLAQHAQPDRHPGVDPARQPFDHPGAQHQLVTDDFGIRGCFFER